VWELTRAEGYHFLSLGAIAVLLAVGMSAFMAVFWSVALGVCAELPAGLRSRLGTLQGAAAGAVDAQASCCSPGVRASEAVFLGVATSLAACGLPAAGRADRAAGRRIRRAPARFEALIDGARNVVSIAVTCACAGLIVSVITLHRAWA
jgi:TRAP-type uncharacterized transport system fused permease subunit